MSKKIKIGLRVIAYREDAVWLAHCLELDIVAEGKTAHDAVKDLIDLCSLQVRVAIEEGDLQSILRPAPAAIWQMFFTSEKRRILRPPHGTPLEQIEERELELV